MTPQQLISLIADHNGIQRKNKFSVTFNCTNCNGVVLNSQDSIPAIYMNIGQRGVELTPDRMTGPGIGRNIPTNPTFESDKGLLLRFPIEQDWKTYKLINDWLGNLAITTAGQGSGQPESGTVTAARYYDDCAKNGTVTVKAERYNGNVACTFTFTEAFPALILPIDFDAEANTGNSTFDVIFNFRTYSVTLPT
jgi:hypothetical protein